MRDSEPAPFSNRLLEFAKAGKGEIVFRFFLAVSIATLVALLVWTPASNEGGNSAQLLAPDAAVVDLGAVSEGQVATGTVMLRNTSHAILDIADAIQSCSCVKPEIESRSLPPGASEPLKVSLDTESGQSRAAVVVRYTAQSDGVERRLPLQLQCTINRLVAFSPSNVTFNLCGDPAVTAVVVHVRPRPGSNAYVESVYATHPGIMVDLINEGAGCKSFRVSVSPEEWIDDFVQPLLHVRIGGRVTKQYTLKVNVLS